MKNWSDCSLTTETFHIQEESHADMNTKCMKRNNENCDDNEWKNEEQTSTEFEHGQNLHSSRICVSTRFGTHKATQHHMTRDKGDTPTWSQQTGEKMEILQID